MSGPSSAPFALLAAEAWKAIYKHWLLGARECVRKHGKGYQLGKLFGPWPPFRSKGAAWKALSAAVVAETIRRRASEPRELQMTQNTQNAGGMSR